MEGALSLCSSAPWWECPELLIDDIIYFQPIIFINKFGSHHINKWSVNYSQSFSCEKSVLNEAYLISSSLSGAEILSGLVTRTKETFPDLASISDIWYSPLCESYERPDLTNWRSEFRETKMSKMTKMTCPSSKDQICRVLPGNQLGGEQSPSLLFAFHMGVFKYYISALGSESKC